MHLSRPARVALGLFVAVGLAFVYLPLLVVVIESFNPARVSSWPPDGFTADWWARAWDNPGARRPTGSKAHSSTPPVPTITRQAYAFTR